MRGRRGGRRRVLWHPAMITMKRRPAGLSSRCNKPKATRQTKSRARTCQRRRSAPTRLDDATSFSVDSTRTRHGRFRVAN
jgi:hypothetical protein